MAATILSPAAIVQPLTDALRGPAASAGECPQPVDVPAALDVLTRVRAAAADLERAELAAIGAARAGGATWQQIAAALGMRGRTGAQKRHTDLARRLSGTAQQSASTVTPGPSAPPPPPTAAEPPAAARPPVVDMPRDGAVTSPAGREPAAARHRPVPEIGPEWTITQPSGPGGDVVLWRDGVRVGTAGRAGLTKAWTATRDSGGTVTGLGAAAGRYPTRIRALMALAVDHEASRRRTRHKAARRPSARVAKEPGR
jgi:hypothetical protein